MSELERVEVDAEHLDEFEVGDVIFGRRIERIDRARCVFWVRPPGRLSRLRRWLRHRLWRLWGALQKSTKRSILPATKSPAAPSREGMNQSSSLRPWLLWTALGLAALACEDEPQPSPSPAIDVPEPPAPAAEEPVNPAVYDRLARMRCIAAAQDHHKDVDWKYFDAIASAPVGDSIRVTLDGRRAGKAVRLVCVDAPGTEALVSHALEK